MQGSRKLHCRVGDQKQLIMSKNIPTHLTHKPIVAIDYEKIDEEAKGGDAMSLSIGKATWDNEKDYSAKIFRRTYNTGRWSRQGEELALWRLLDLATLLVATIKGKESEIGAIIVSSNKDLEALRKNLRERKDLEPRIEKLKSLLLL